MLHTDRGVRFSATIAVLFLMLAGFAFGQGIVTGSVSGTVQDVNKAVIPGATVKAVQTDTNATFTTQTDSQGFFMLKGLPIGVYTVSIEATKFAKLQLNGIDVDSGRNIGLPMQTMQVGSASEVVNVEAATPLVETTTAQIGANFDTRAVQQLPNPGAGFDNLVLYVPGVAQNNSANFSNTNGAAIANNGLRGRSNNFQIDGQGNNDNSVAGPSIFLSNPDVVSELQVVTNNFGAEYGRNTGSVVNYVTKSGTNAFHGTAYDFNTGNWSFSHASQEKEPAQGFCPEGVAAGSKVLNSNGQTLTSSCRAPIMPHFVENRWGGTLGGPIVKNKAWFFGSYQNDRQRQVLARNTTSFTPTPNGLAALAAAFPNSAGVKALLAMGPYSVKSGNPQPLSNTKVVNVTDGTTKIPVEFAGIQRNVPSPFDDTQVTGRGDWQISNKDRFFSRYVFQKSLSFFGSGTGSTGAFVSVPGKDQQIGLDYTRTWSPRFLQQFRTSYSRAKFSFEGGAYPNCTIANVTACPVNIAFTSKAAERFTLAGVGLATNLPQDRLINNTQFDNNSTWNLGRHTVKFGGEYARQRSPNHFLPNINGGFRFTSTAVICTPNQANCTSTPENNAISQLVQGKNSSLSLADGPFTFNFKEQDVSYYGQDDWRIKDNLTVNLGLRWEWDQQAVNLLHDITVANVANGFWSASAPSKVTILPKIPQDLNNYAPNVGFAYTPRVFKSLFGDEKTVFRGGYRIAYDPAFYNIFSNMATAAPVVNLGSLANVALPASGTGAGAQSAYFPLIPRGTNPGARSQTRVTNDFHNPYTEQWSFGIERTVNSKVAFESRYVGNHTVGNFTTINGNPRLDLLPSSILPAGVKPCTTAGAPGLGREDCDFSLVRVRNNGAFSIYHGLQNQVNLRNWHNFTANVAYTWSKAIDNVSEIFQSDAGIGTPIAQNPFDTTNGERGVSAQSFPHVVTSYWIYELPWMKSQQGIVGKVLGGYQIGGTYRYQTGAPFTPYQAAGFNPACDSTFSATFIGVENCRPILANPNAPFDQVGNYTKNATTGVVTLQNNSTGLPTTTNDVHFIINSQLADSILCNGNPFACTVSRNTFRSQSRNQLDMSVQKGLKFGERVNLQLRADMFNVTNYMFRGLPDPEVDDVNVANAGTFGGNLFRTSGRRFMQLSAHITF